MVTKQAKHILNTRVSEVYKILLKNRVIEGEQSFADKIGYKQPTINAVLNNKANPGRGLLLKIIDVYQVNPDYLFEGDEPMFNILPGKNENDINQKKAEEDGALNNCYFIPLKAVGGFLTGYENKVFMNTVEKVPFPLIRGTCYMFEVEGLSMYVTKFIDGLVFEVGYKPGSHVVVTRVHEFDMLRTGSEYIFQTIDGIILKTFIKCDKEFCYMKSINEEYNPVKPLHLKSIKGLYFVEKKINEPIK